MRLITVALIGMLSTTAAADEPLSPEQRALASSIPGQVKPDNLHWDLELLYLNSQWQQGLDQSRARLAENPDDADLYWHVARFLFEMGELVDRNDTSVDKIELYRQMIEVSEAGLERFPDHAHLHFALGIGKGRLGTTRGVLKSLSLLKDVEAAWSHAASSDYVYRSIDGGEQLPCDAQLTLGIFYRLVPDSWIVKVLSGTRGDLQRSQRSLEAANACSPNDIGILKELGVTHLCIADRDDDDDASHLGLGRQSLEQALRLHARGDSTDELDHVHMRMLLDDPSLACEYSRDGQQETDAKALSELEGAQ